MGDPLKLSAVDLPDGVRAPVGDEDLTIALVAAPTVYVETAAAAAVVDPAAAAGAAARCVKDAKGSASRGR